MAHKIVNCNHYEPNPEPADLYSFLGGLKTSSIFVLSFLDNESTKSYVGRFSAESCKSYQVNISILGLVYFGFSLKYFSFIRFEAKIMMNFIPPSQLLSSDESCKEIYM